MKIFCLSTLLILSLLAFCNATTITSSNNNLNKTVTQLEDSIRVLQKRISTLEKNQNLKIEILEERLSQASETITNQNSLLGGFGALYTIITIIIAIVTIGLPFLTYQFGIKPSQDALKNFEDNIDSKFNSFLIKNRATQLDNAIANLTSNDQYLQSNAVNYLALTQHEDLNEQQVYKIVKVLRSKKLDNASSSTVAFVLSSKRNEVVTDFFQDAIFESNQSLKISSLYYFFNTGIENHIDILRKLLSKSGNRKQEFNFVVSTAAGKNKLSMLFLLNDEKFINLLDKTVLDEVKQSMKSYCQVDLFQKKS